MGLKPETEYRKFTSVGTFKSILNGDSIKETKKEVEKQRMAFAKEFDMMSKDPLWRIVK